MEVSLNPEDVERNKQILDQITEIANEILSRGITSVYQMTFEALDNSMSQWEYRGQDGTIHGPFTSQQIAQWKSQGYFTGDTAVMMRKVSGCVVGKIAMPKKRARHEDKNLSNDLVDDLNSDDEDDVDTAKDIVPTKKEYPWTISDDIDFGDPNDYPSVDKSSDCQLSRKKNDNRVGNTERQAGSRVHFKDQDVSDEEDPDIDGDVNRKSNRKRMKAQDDDDDEEDDNDD
jgi:hypothetical protein